MEGKKLSDLKKKVEFIGVKLSHEEREEIKTFCLKNDLSISDLVRYSVKKVMNEEKAGK